MHDGRDIKEILQEVDGDNVSATHINNWIYTIRSVKKNWLGLNRIVTESKSNWFFPELIQEKMSHYFIKLIRLIQLFL